MTIVQLEYLLAVANCGSFSLASEKCFVTQPSLSMQIKNLEEELGVVLLDRSRKPVIATDAGEVVIRQAREAIKSFKMVRESVADLRGEISGVLRLGVIPTIAPYLLHRFVPGFARDYPNVELQIRELMTTAFRRRSSSTTAFMLTCRPAIRFSSGATSALRISTCGACCCFPRGTV